MFVTKDSTCRRSVSPFEPDCLRQYFRRKSGSSISSRFSRSRYVQSSNQQFMLNQIVYQRKPQQKKYQQLDNKYYCYDILQFDTINKLIDNFEKDIVIKGLSSIEFKEQIDDLLRQSFNKYLHAGSSFTDNLIQLNKKKKIQSENLCTLIALQKCNNEMADVSVADVSMMDVSVAGCVQIVRELATETTKIKYRIINLCRKYGSINKGLGKILLECAFNYLKSLKKPPMCVYLSVSASNTKLQLFYQNLGWKNTYKFDTTTYIEPTFELLYFI